MRGIRGLAREPFREPWAGRSGYRLHYNENLFLPREYYVELYGALGDPEETRFYSDPRNWEARTRVAEHFGVDPDMVLLAPGVDALLSLVSDAAAVLEWRVTVPEPTYGMYREKLLARRVALDEPPLSAGWEPPWERLDGDLVVLCSPNNPTGNLYPRDRVRGLLEGGRALVVVDETYADYASDSLLGLVGEYENLLVLRSFSKSWGLAGARIGAALGSPDVIAGLEALSDPYSLPLQSRKLLVRALELRRYVEDAVRRTREARERLLRGLEAVGVTPYPSEANFVLFKAPGARRLLKALAGRGYLLRDVSDKPLLRDHLRVTVPPSPVLEGFLDALEESLGEVEAV